MWTIFKWRSHKLFLHSTASTLISVFRKVKIKLRPFRLLQSTAPIQRKEKRRSIPEIFHSQRLILVEWPTDMTFFFVWKWRGKCKRQKNPSSLAECSSATIVMVIFSMACFEYKIYHRQTKKKRNSNGWTVSADNTVYYEVQLIPVDTGLCLFHRIHCNKVGNKTRKYVWKLTNTDFKAFLSSVFQVVDDRFRSSLDTKYRTKFGFDSLS